jgi:hypothetical protein
MLAALVLTLAVTLYRVCYALAGAPADWANFSPVAAILFCSAAYLSRKAVVLAALGPLVVADLLLNAHYHALFLTTQAASAKWLARNSDAPFSGYASPTVARAIHDYGNSGTSRRRRD